MVNTGHPSRGCLRCRKRKIKCDEGRPACVRCTKIHKPCPGYEQEEGCFIQRSYVPQSEPSSQSDTSSSSRHMSSAPESIEDARVAHQLERLSVHASPPPGPKFRSDTQSSTSFINNDRLRELPNHLGSSFVEILPGMCRQAVPGSCILEVLNAISLASYANHWNPVEFKPLLQTQYGRALQAVNKAISNPREASESATLMSVHLLGTFEFITGDCALERSPGHGWRTHTEGTLRIFSVRDTALSFTPEGRRLFLLLHIAYQLKALLFGEELPDFILNMTIRVWQLEYRTPTISAQVITYFHQATKLRARAMKFLRANSADGNSLSTNILNIINVANILNAEVSGWAEEDDNFRPRRVRPEQFPRQFTESYKLQAKFYYKKFEVFLHWYRYYLVRIKLHATLIDCLEALSRRGNTRQDVHSQIQQYKEVIQSGINGFLGSIAFSLGEVSEDGIVRAATSAVSSHRGFLQVNSESAIRLLIPLQDLARSPYASSTQRQAISHAFERISMELRFPWATTTPRWARPDIQ